MDAIVDAQPIDGYVGLGVILEMSKNIYRKKR